MAIECNTGKLFSLTRCSALPAVFHTADSNHSTRKGRSLTLDLLAMSHEDRYSFTAFYSKPSFPGLFTLPPSTFSFSFWEREFLGSTLYNLLQKELVQNCRWIKERTSFFFLLFFVFFSFTILFPLETLSEALKNVQSFLFRTKRYTSFISFSSVVRNTSKMLEIIIRSVPMDKTFEVVYLILSNKLNTFHQRKKLL